MLIYRVSGSFAHHAYHFRWRIDKDRIFTVLYVMIFAAYMFFSCSHLLFLDEEVADGKSLKNSRDIASMIEEIDVRTKNVDTPVKYFDTLRFIHEVNAQCHLFQVISNGTNALAYHPCSRWMMRQGMIENNFANSVRNRFSVEEMRSVGQQYDLHSDVLIKHKWHPEEFWIFYTNGMMISAILFLIRLYRKGFKIGLELILPRFALALLLWPAAIWMYPGDVRRQLRDALRMSMTLLATTVSCLNAGFVKAESKTKSGQKNREDSMIDIHGFSQGVLKEYDPKGMQFGNVRLRMIWTPSDDWKVVGDFGLSPNDFDVKRQIRQLFVQKKTSLGTFAIGRMFSEAGWTTPPPWLLETVSYPDADPSRGESYGLQYSNTLGGGVTLHASVTGVSGKAFDDMETNFSAMEQSFRIEWKASPATLFALTGQMRDDVHWMSGEFHFEKGMFSSRTVVYGGYQKEGDVFVNGYSVATVTPDPHFSAHAMFDHSGIKKQDRFVIGGTIFPFGNRNLSVTVDKIFGLNGSSDRSDAFELRLQLAF